MKLQIHYIYSAVVLSLFDEWGKKAQEAKGLIHNHRVNRKINSQSEPLLIHFADDIWPQGRENGFSKCGNEFMYEGLISDLTIGEAFRLKYTSFQSLCSNWILWLVCLLLRHHFPLGATGTVLGDYAFPKSLRKCQWEKYIILNIRKNNHKIELINISFVVYKVWPYSIFKYNPTHMIMYKL